MTTPAAPRDLDRTRATGADLRAALQSASAWLTANADRVNALNVFPVPDGDTGTNMSMTLGAAVDGLSGLGDEPSIGQVARAAYEAAMLGARGNSGVILSQLLSGFSRSLADAKELTPLALAGALGEASQVAYRGVSQPVEGTILTVAREAAAAGRVAAEAGGDLPGVLEQTLKAAGEAVAATPMQLEVLRKAGVVDSGGEGYRVLLEGAWMWSTGRTVELKKIVEPRAYPAADLHGLDDCAASAFGFCTEFLLRDCDLPLPEVEQRMLQLGDSVIAVGDGEMLRVHVHTPRPGQALEFAVDHGTLARVKVENMQLQHQAFAAGSGANRSLAQDTAPPASTIGVIAVAAGDGLLDVFRSLGAHVVQGGQTMNPSVQEILTAVSASGYEQLIVLPNNTNIILTAQHVQELTTRTVTVVPTETVPQGIGALLAFNFQADMQTNVAAMERAAHAIHTVEVTRSVRDAEVDGLRVKAGDMLGIYDGHIIAVGDTAGEALLKTFDQAPLQTPELVTVYYGAGASASEAHTLADRLRDARPALTVEVVEGGQPHYPYLASLE